MFLLLSHRRRIPGRVHLTCLDHRLVVGCLSLTSLSQCMFTRTIQLSSLSRRQVRPKVTVHALSPCSLQGAAIQFTQPNKLLLQNLCRFAHFHMHKKTYVRSLLHVTRQAAVCNGIILKSIFHPCVVAESATDSELTLINSPPPRLGTDDCRNIYMFFKLMHRNIPLIS